MAEKAFWEQDVVVSSIDKVWLIILAIVAIVGINAFLGGNLLAFLTGLLTLL